VHGQVKVCLLLVELKVRNKLQGMRSEQLARSSSNTDTGEIREKVQEIQEELCEGIDRSRKALTKQICELEEHAHEEVKLMKDNLRKRNEKLETLAAEQLKLLAEIQIFEGQPEDSIMCSDTSKGAVNVSTEDADVADQPIIAVALVDDAEIASAEACSEEKAEEKTNVPGTEVESREQTGCENVNVSDVDKDQQPLGASTVPIDAPVFVSGSVLDRLHIEAMNIVERMKEKNETIELLKTHLDRSKLREQNLKRELKRRVIRLSEKKQKRAKKKKTSRSSGTTAPASSPTPVSPESTTISFHSPVKSPSSSIIPLEPSPREISKPRNTVVE